MKAVVATERGNLAVVDVELDPPRSGEVRVRMMATGVCHSDLSILNPEKSPISCCGRRSMRCDWPYSLAPLAPAKR